MKKIIFVAILSFCSVSFLSAQQDPAARAILDKAIALLQHSAVRITFTTTIEASNTRRNNVSGILTVMGNKCKVNMNGVESYFDGKTQWVFAPDNNEVTISAISAKNQKQMNPLSVLAQYRGKNTKIIFNRESKQSANQVAIDLFPTAKSANEFRILVKFNKKANTPQSIQLFGRDGSKTTVVIKTFQKISADNKMFVFDMKAHPRISVNDLR